MTTGSFLLASCILGCSLTVAADWLNEGGDARRTACQVHERALSTASVKDLRLLWRRQLSDAGAALSSPVILGRLTTHRGTVELVFVAGASSVYAVDGDFGTVFWQRRLDSYAATPVIAPAQPGFNEEEDDDAPQPLRPLYAVAKDGRLHALHPGDGHDLSTSWNFLRPGSAPSSLNMTEATVYAATREGVWSIRVDSPDSKPGLRHSAGPGSEGVTVAADGHILAGAFAAFKWKQQPMTAGLDRQRQLILRKADLTIASRGSARGFHGTVASCEDKSGRLIYAAQAGGIVAFRLEERNRRPVLTPLWNSPPLVAPSAPVIAGGVVFTVSRAEHAILYGLDALTGKLLYSSGAAVTVPVKSGVLAVANGHVCFTAGGALYCFGFPVDV